MGILGGICWALFFIVIVVIIGILGVTICFLSMMAIESGGEFIKGIREIRSKRVRRQKIRKYIESRIDWYQVNGDKGEFFILNGSDHLMRKGSIVQYLGQLGKDIFVYTHSVYLNGGKYDSAIFWEYIME